MYIFPLCKVQSPGLHLSNSSDEKFITSYDLFHMNYQWIQWKLNIAPALWRCTFPENSNLPVAAHGLCTVQWTRWSEYSLCPAGRVDSGHLFHWDGETGSPVTPGGEEGSRLKTLMLVIHCMPVFEVLQMLRIIYCFLSQDAHLRLVKFWITEVFPNHYKGAVSHPNLINSLLE